MLEWTTYGARDRLDEVQVTLAPCLGIDEIVDSLVQAVHRALDASGASATATWSAGTSLAAFLTLSYDHVDKPT